MSLVNNRDINYTPFKKNRLESTLETADVRGYDFALAFVAETEHLTWVSKKS